MAAAIQRGLLTVALTTAAYWGIPSPAFAQVIEGFRGEYAPSNWQLFNDNTDGKAFLKDTEGNLSIYTSEPGSDPSEAPALAPDSLFLLGGNQADEIDCETAWPVPEACGAGFASFIFVGLSSDFGGLTEDSLISFSWNYQTSDDLPFWDPFRYVIAEIDSSGTQILPTTIVDLVDLEGPVQQSGRVTDIRVNAGQLFGFQIRSLDNRNGAASVLIDQFKAILLPKPCGETPGNGQNGSNCPPKPPKSVPEPGVAISTLLLGAGLLKLRRRPTL